MFSDDVTGEISELFECLSVPGWLDFDSGYNLVGSIRDVEASKGVAWLRGRGIDASDHGDRLAEASQWRIEAGRERARLYQRALSPEKKAKKVSQNRAYYATEKGKAARLETNRRRREKYWMLRAAGASRNEASRGRVNARKTR